MTKSAAETGVDVKPDCFVIMPIADTEGYDKGHFSRVFEDIFQPACVAAGFCPVRADSVKQTNLIHLDILGKLIESPIAICDLSSRNPNVLFELGLRQAFDKPTVLVQEVGTPKIFDIAPLRYTEYRRELKYREVLEDQGFISKAIKATMDSCDAGEGVNSIVSILSLAKPAALKDVSQDDASRMLQLIRAEMSEMRSDFRQAMNSIDRKRPTSPGQFGGGLPPRMAEASHRLREAERLLETGGPSEVIIEMIASVQKLLSRYFDEGSGSYTRRFAEQMMQKCYELERKIVRDEKDI